jgi:hypothetical protein
VRTNALPRGLLIAALLGSIAIHASATSPLQLQAQFETITRKTAPAFDGFSAQRGAQFFKVRHGGEWACASCLTDNPFAAKRLAFDLTVWTVSLVAATVLLAHEAMAREVGSAA